MADIDLPVIDLAPLLALPPGTPPTPAVLAQAAAAAAGLHTHGLLIVRDPRASEADNSAFLDLMEAYFGQPEPAKLADVRKEQFYQVGTTPSRVELPRNHCDRMRAFKDADKPLSLCPPEKDPKWRALCVCVCCACACARACARVCGDCWGRLLQEQPLAHPPSPPRAHPAPNPHTPPTHPQASSGASARRRPPPPSPCSTRRPWCPRPSPSGRA